MKRKQYLAVMLSISIGLTAVMPSAFAEESADTIETQATEIQYETERQEEPQPVQTETVTPEQIVPAPAPQSESETAPQTEPQTSKPEENTDGAEAMTQDGSADGEEETQEAETKEAEAKEDHGDSAAEEKRASAKGQNPQSAGQTDEEALEAAAEENFLKIVRATAGMTEGEIRVELVTENPDYDTLYFGKIQDERRQPAFTGEKNDRGGYTFTFAITPDLVGKIVPYVPGKQGENWYTDHALYLKLPKEVRDAAEETEPESGETAAEAAEADGAQAPAEDPHAEETDSAAAASDSVLFLEETEKEITDTALFLAADGAAQINNTTTLADGEYDPENFEFAGGTKKATLTCEKVIVSSGKVTAVMRVSSDYMTHAYLGETPSSDETSALYDPDTDICGANVYVITDQTVTIPAQLNRETALAVRTTAMSAPHWVQYRYTITLKEPEKESEETEQSQQPAEGKTNLAVTNNTGMFKAVSAYLDTKNGVTNLVMTMSGSGYHYMYKGTYEAAVANNNNRKAWLQGKQDSDGKWQFTVPVARDETYIPVVAISQSYLEKYDSGSSALERAFFPRQLTIDVAKKTLVTDDYNEDVQVTVTSKVSAVKVESKASMNVVGGPNSNNYACTPVLKMSDAAYDQVKYPTVLDEAVGEETVSLSGDKTFTINLKNAPGISAFEDKKAFNVSFREKSSGNWVKYSMTIDKLGKTIVIGEAVKEEENNNSSNNNSSDNNNSNGGGSDGGKTDSGKTTNSGSKTNSSRGGSGGGGSTGGGNSGYKATVGGSTGAVNSSTGLVDGDYTPDSFSWSGGTGKLSISCSGIRVSGGKTYATIVFSSGKITYVKAGGSQFTPIAQTSDTSTYEIPVQLNANNKILACTTAMSQPHEIEYTIYVGLEAAKEAALGDTSGISASSAGSGAAGNKAVAEDGSALEKLGDAPKIAGLDYEGTAQNQYAKYFRLHYYKDGFRVLEITLSEEETPDWNIEPEEKTETEADVADVAGVDEGSAPVQKSLYEGAILQYLIAPEGKELPAGMDKDMIIVQLPVEKAYVDSNTALKMLDKLQVLDQVGAVGATGQECEVDSVVRAMADGDIESIGHYDETSVFKALVVDGMKFAIVPAEILERTERKGAEDGVEEPEDGAKDTEDTQAAEVSRVQDIGDSMALLKIPMLVDRADDEKEELAKYEWLKVYGAIFDCEKEAGEAFQAAEEALKK